MSITSGFTTPLSDAVVTDTFFDQIQTGGNGSVSSVQTNELQNVVSTYVLVSVAGDLVYENQQGDPQFVSGTPTGLFPLSAVRILSSATVRGTPRTTTASVSSWFAGYKY